MQLPNKFLRFLSNLFLKKNKDLVESEEERKWQERVKRAREYQAPQELIDEVEKLHELITPNCLTHEELMDLQHNHTIEMEAGSLLDRILHVARCKFCRGFLEVADPEKMVEILSRPKYPLPEDERSRIIEYYKREILPENKCISEDELIALLKALKDNQKITLKAEHVVAKAWHIEKCSDCKNMFLGAGLF